MEFNSGFKGLKGKCTVLELLGKKGNMGVANSESREI
jgi:hypothetical protein